MKGDTGPQGDPGTCDINTLLGLLGDIVAAIKAPAEDSLSKVFEDLKISLEYASKAELSMKIEEENGNEFQVTTLPSVEG